MFNQDPTISKWNNRRNFRVRRPIKVAKPARIHNIDTQSGTQTRISLAFPSSGRFVSRRSDISIYEDGATRSIRSFEEASVYPDFSIPARYRAQLSFSLGLKLQSCCKIAISFENWVTEFRNDRATSFKFCNEKIGRCRITWKMLTRDSRKTCDQILWLRKSFLIIRQVGGDRDVLFSLLRSCVFSSLYNDRGKTEFYKYWN